MNEHKDRKPKMNQDQDPELIKKQNEWHDHAETDKYIALEQPGVSYTDDHDFVMNADNVGNSGPQLTYDSTGTHNSRNADAFSQDDYILNDNIDLDEDQNTSISSENNDK
jgi:hypothetical protein